MDSKPSRAKRTISEWAAHGFISRFSRSTRCAFVSLMASLTRCLLRNAKAKGGRLLRGLRSAFCLGAATFALLRSASSDVPEGYLDPCFTARTLGRHAARGPLHPQDGVLHDDLSIARHDDLGGADLTAAALGKVAPLLAGRLRGSGQDRLHGPNNTIPIGYVKNSL